MAMAVAVMVVCIGCEPGVKSPTYTPDTTSTGDTTGNGDDTTGTGGGYGTLYFKADASTRWICELPVNWSNAALVALNAGADTLVKEARLQQPIDFGDSRGLTFTWRGGVISGASYQFFVGEPPDHWMEVPYHTNELDIEEARISIYLDPGAIYCRYEFTLPPGSQVRITDIRGYGW